MLLFRMAGGVPVSAFGWFVSASVIVLTVRYVMVSKSKTETSGRRPPPRQGNETWGRAARRGRAVTEPLLPMLLLT